MASILQILRRIGGAKAAPATGKAGELALWKAGTAPADLRALYVHDGTQYIPLVDYATETLPGVAALATKAEVDALTVANKIVTPAMLKDVIKERLFANRTIYVRTDGADTNKGDVNTAAGALKTVQAAIQICYNLDLNGFNVDIRIADGTYTGFVVSVPFLNGAVSVLGNAADVSKVVISGTVSCARASLKIGDVTVSAAATTAGAIMSVDTGSITFVGKIRFLDSYARVNYGTIDGRYGNITFERATLPKLTALFTCSEHGSMLLQFSQIAFINDPTADNIVETQGLSTMSVVGATITGTAIGKRYLVQTNAVVVSGGGPNAIPGTIAGVVATGGQYV